MLISEKILTALIVPLIIIAILNMIDSKHYKKNKQFVLLFTYIVCSIPGLVFYFKYPNGPVKNFV